MRVSKVLDEMVGVVEKAGYEVPEGIGATDFLEAVESIIEDDKDMDAAVLEWLSTSLDAVLEAAAEDDEDGEEDDEDEKSASKSASKKAAKPAKDAEAGDEEECAEGDEECAARKAKKEAVENDDDHFVLDEDTDTVMVSDTMSDLLDEMVAMIESEGYDVESGAGVAEFLDGVCDFMGTATGLDEAKSAWLHKAHAHAIEKLGKMKKVGHSNMHIRAFSKPHKHSKR